MKCGVMAGTGVSFCPNCGSRTDPNAVICVKCGAGFSQFLGEGTAHKSRLVAGLLGIFLGVFGIHNFYLGYNKKAVAQLLITVLTFGIFSFVSAIWGFIEGILILIGSIKKAADGTPLKE